MPRLPRVTATEVHRALQRAGWYEHRSRGGHVILKNDTHPGARVTLAMHRRKTVKPKTLQAILSQAGLSVDEFTELL
ncbi:MAG: type II toxin-antitoxin system HicA family toxin [Alphaproteobacteria bacterium]